MRSLTLPLEEYEKDLAKAEVRGRKEASRRFMLILEQAKKDPRDAILMIVEDFEDDQAQIDRMLVSLGLMDLAEEIWSGK